MEMIEIVHKTRLKTIARLWLYLLKFYFRIEVEGIENVPRKGRALVISNHSGFAGADAILLTFIIKRNTLRRARILAHRAFFDFSKTLKQLSESHGLRKASVLGGVEILKNERLLILFPEGEAGNFKSSYKRYQLQPFHTGFLRMAIQARSPIIPCVIIGAEESHFNIGNLNLSAIIKNLRIPIPLNFLPLPAKWRIVFLPPIESKEIGPPEIILQKKKLQLKANKIQKQLQKEINRRLKMRKYIYSKPTRKFTDGIFKRLGLGV